jgi:rare lipoprotein A
VRINSSGFVFLLATALTLGACGTAPRYEAPAAKLPPSAPVTPPSVTTKGGGYYLDDGPGENPPPNLESVPDAVPRAEALHRGALRPYTVMGRNYVPMTAIEPYRARGVASWYGRRYHGKLTSTGEPYDMYGMSAAHPTLPLPSYVRVTSVANGKSVIVRVNDRGPFIDSRLIDLSYTAAYKLGVLAGGSGLVDVELILPGAPAATASAPPLVPAPPVVAEAPPAAERQIPMAAESGGVHLQLAAFGSKENAEAYASRLRGDLVWLASQLQVYTRDGLFRVLAGPFANQSEARQNADKISQSLGIKPFVLVK